MSFSSLLSRAVCCGCVALPFFLAGCSGDGTVTVNPVATPLAVGNWQVSANVTSAVKLPVLSGAFTTKDDSIAAVLHPQGALGCMASNASFALSGTEDDKSNVTLSGAVAGGTLTLTGTLASDGKSLTDAAYSVAGGSCAQARTPVLAQNYEAVTGTYSGAFKDGDGQLVSLSADFSQSTAPDGNGNFTLAGTATLPSNPCFPSSVPITNTQVTGGTFTFTYSADNNSVTASGTFSSDANTLTVTNWISSGTCGADQGTGSMMK